MGPNPAIERVISNILSLLDKSVVEKIEPIEIPGQPDEEFTSPVTVDGEIQFYSIDRPLYNLFKTVIKRFDGRNLKSIELISYPLESGNISDIEKLSNDLYEILKDNTVGGLGRFNKTDAFQVTERKTWSGKLWIDYQTGSLITLDLFDGVTRLSIIKDN